MKTMFKHVLIALVLLLFLAEHSLNVEANQRTKLVRSHHSEVRVREKRFANPLTTIYNIWNALGHMYSLIVQQKNETQIAFEQTYDILADGFNDTYMATLRPTTTTTPLPDVDPTPSTQRYRITRKELGYILGRNYRGLKKLFNIELNDALNQSKYNIAEYKREKAYALAPYTIKKFTSRPNTTSNDVDN